MNYQDTVSWMFQQLPMYQNQGKAAFKKDLTNTLVFAEHLNHPERNFKSVHVAGTNGKGSTSHGLASVLQEAGYKVGLYTSPHLKDYRERIKINGKEVSEAFVIEFIKQNTAFLEQHKLSFFEMSVGMAFAYFAEEQVDIAIIEVGLGGRLDSTNIITPEVSVITNIGLDHVQFLGNTLELIAKEKAGIIKPNIPVVVGETQPETETVFRSTAIQNNAAIYFADQLIKSDYVSDLKGAYQKHNMKTVLQTLAILNQNAVPVSEETIKNGLLNIVKNTGLLGRWQVLAEHPKTVCDTAHNKEGLIYTFKQIQTETFEHLHVVFGVVNDKDISAILPILPKDAQYYFCKPNVPRGLDAELLKSRFLENGFKGEAFESVTQALAAARRNASRTDFIYIGGSTFVVAEVV
ncbi:bifunctional folylpolyglutamate synthase/dihydrofolate synthase [Subsaximicrobium wynnwilliamsii]|uniref:Dihydrofolate synthase/folylpolyglutamate synthase n=1 Tax=Subsaximicrobium wynnwilliamsii TaxID=291179 RepID=A0A5C6ZGF6_9FLAO|nr:folylpolyglutamate synthase/dihydrofolate synthase family protein [Subsaximicrobium wynnwilliamsii]TXD82108.1 bifunctional folylpolyglutamate synthase/dihydrofolate synthase [Subsaximicrobium wynnwilliamsii]TXD87753.1 bifunctional folylpolyglutamate synthase/dihydrofolate synthase [Subsaximicrobium wynnwilliamsii]TXE01564.1 bifunctional folylpolyglutamate synthase/dihydrofolate synthase [Subsaximicrobium wynnwilliamsii]